MKKGFMLNRKLSYTTLCDLSLLIYFCVMFAHQRENTLDTLLRYESLILLMGVYFFVYPPLENLKTNTPIRISIFEIWLLSIFFYGTISMIWSINPSNAWNVLINLGKIIIVCFLIRPHLNNRKSIEHVLKLLLIALCYMLCILMIRTPASAWGSERIGEAINLHSNEVGRLVCLGGLITVYFLTSQKKYRFLLIALVGAFGFCSLMTGSKGVLFILFFQLGLYSLLTSRNWKKFIVVFGVISLGLAGYRLIMTNEVLYNLVGFRLEGMLEVFGNKSNADGSTLERLFFMQTAWNLFKEHTLTGIGINNFSAYLSSIGYSNAVYSHAGFLEVLSTLGLIGFVIYYFMYVKTIKSLTIPALKHDKLCAVLLTVTLRVFLFDTISISIYRYNSYITLLLAFCMGVCIKNEMVAEKGN